MADYVGADYVGDDELENLLNAAGMDDDDDDVGAAPTRRNKIARLALSGRLPAIFLGFDQTVAASVSANATSEPNVAVRPTDLVVRDTNAADWQFTTIRIGRVDLLAGATPIPSECFRSTVVRPPISSPVLQAGTLCTIGLTNLSAASSRFLAMFTCLDCSKRPVSP